jgi:hypothetical protein
MRSTYTRSRHERASRKRITHYLDQSGVDYDENASTQELAELAECTYGPMRRLKEWTATAWRVLKALAVMVGFMQAIGFTSFIWEETMQCAGFACKGAIDAHDSTIAAECLERFHHLSHGACGWEKYFGWACPWMHPAFQAYFNKAATAQLASYYAMGVEKGLWTEDEARLKEGVDSWQFDKAIERARAAAARLEVVSFGGHKK